jgi:hypothetical protein
MGPGSSLGFAELARDDRLMRSQVMAALLLAAFPLLPIGAQAVPLAPDAFTLYVRTALVRGTHAPIAIKGPLMLSIHYDEGVDRLADLGNLHRRCFHRGGVCAALVRDYVQDVRRQVERMARDHDR